MQKKKLVSNNVRLVPYENKNENILKLILEEMRSTLHDSRVGGTQQEDERIRGVTQTEVKKRSRVYTAVGQGQQEKRVAQFSRASDPA